MKRQAQAREGIASNMRVTARFRESLERARVLDGRRRTVIANSLGDIISAAGAIRESVSYLAEVPLRQGRKRRRVIKEMATIEVYLFVEIQERLKQLRRLWPVLESELMNSTDRKRDTKPRSAR